MWALHWFSELVPLRAFFGMKNSQRLTKDFHASPSNQLLGLMLGIMIKSTP
jgi:hypothetical protein